MQRADTEELHCSCGGKLLPLGQGDPLFGVVVGEKYLLLDRLGEGGMGRVYRAYHLNTHAEVALKVIPATSNQEQSDRFFREVKVTARLTSPHTVQATDFGRLHSGELFLVMKYLSGKPLDQVIQEDAPLSAERALELTQQICAALAEAHGLGMTHRDIKPSNVIIEKQAIDEEHVMVLDFGLVHLAERSMLDSERTPAQVLCGTPAYMAPELWSAAMGEPGPQTDVYAIGAVLYKMLTGVTPFVATSASGYADRHLNDSWPSLPGRRFAPIAKVLARCSAKRPADRYASAKELRAALELAARAMRGEPTLPPEPLPDTISSSERPQVDRGMSPAPGGSGRWRAAVLGSAAALLIATWFLPERLVGAGTPESPVATTLVVNSNPPGAAILIDGQPIGHRTPATIRGVPVGRTVTVEAQSSGRLPTRKQLELSAGSEQQVQLMLEQATGTLEIQGLGLDEPVLIDGQPVDGTTAIVLPIGLYKIAFPSRGPGLRLLLLRPGTQQIRLDGFAGARR